MQLIFVNRFYWPETPATGQLLTDLAEGLAARGWNVTVITSAASAGAPVRETHLGVRILRLASTRWAGAIAGGKVVDFVTFLLCAMWRVWRESRADTIVIPMTDPPMLGVGAWLSVRWRGARLVHWVQDIYPEIAMELFRQRWLCVLRSGRDCAWRSAVCCVTLGTDMAQILAKAEVASERIRVIPNWAPAGVTPIPRDDLLPLRREWGLVGKFVVAYAGNLGRVHDLEAVIALAEALRDCPLISVILIGDGPQRAALARRVRQRELANLAFHSPQPRHRLRETLALGDLHLVTLLPGCEHYVLPSKLYGIVAAGRPVLFIGPSNCEVARCVEENGLGLAATRSDVVTMASFVRRLAADPAKYKIHADATVAYARSHTAATAIESWHNLLAMSGQSEETTSVPANAVDV